MRSAQGLIWISLTFGMGIMTALSYFFVPEFMQLEPRQPLEVWNTEPFVVLGGMAAALILLSLSRGFRNPDNVLVRSLLKAPEHLEPNRQKAVHESQKFVMSLAMLEATAICGFVLSFKTQSQIGFPFGILALLASFSMRPKLEEPRP